MRIKQRLCGGVLLLLILLISTPLHSAAQEGGAQERALLRRIATLRAQPTIYSDQFDENGLTWTLGSARQTVVGLMDDMLYFRLRRAGGGNAALAAMELSDFLLEVTAHHLSGAPDATAGLLFRVQNPNSFYVFQVSASGTYAVSKVVDGHAQHLTAPTIASAIQRGEDVTNRLAVFADGDRLAFLINDVPVQTLTDPSFARGVIGLGAASYGAEGVEIAFDDLSVWAIGSDSAAPAAVSTPVPPPAPGVLAPTATPLPKPTAAPTAEPTATPTMRPLSLDTLPIDWTTLERDFVISNVRLLKGEETGDDGNNWVTFDVTARDDLGLFAYMVNFNDAEGKLTDSAELMFTLAPDALALTDFIGGWNAGAFGNAAFLLPRRLAGVESITFDRFF